MKTQILLILLILTLKVNSQNNTITNKSISSIIKLDRIESNNSRTVFTYDTNGNNVKIEGYPSSSGDWRAVIYDYTYNADNLLIEFYSWVDGTENKEIYEYDDENKLIQIKYYYYFYDPSSPPFGWELTYKEDYFYETGSSKVNQIFRSNYSDFVYIKNFISYNEYGYITQNNQYSWDEDTDDWYLNSQIYYYYDSSNNNIEILKQSRDDLVSAWHYDWKKEKSYDENNNIIQRVYSRWNSVDHYWYYLQKTSNIVFNLSVETSEILPTNDSSWWGFKSCNYNQISNNKVEQNDFYQLNYATNEWDAPENVEYYYSETSLSVENNRLNNNLFTLFPNPTNSNIQIATKLVNTNNIQIEIYNHLGQKVLSFNNINNKNLNLGSLQDGVYMVRINKDDFIEVKKLIIKK